mgnify:CR=1 FL=1|jgi:pimeloyl-ACP methyl ester carboxylesterase
MKKIIALLLALSFVLGAAPVCFAQEGEKNEMTDYGFVDCGDVKIEYGVYGKADGETLLLLPPNGGDMHSLDGTILPEMSKHFRVVTVSPRGTGNSGWVDGTMNFETFADDVKAVLDYLGIEKTHIFGFSDGGNLGFVFTLKYQERVSSLTVMGSNINTWGTNTFDQIQITYQYIVLVIEAWLKGDDATKIRRDIKGMMVGQPSLTFADISKIEVPFFNIYGEHDMIQRWHSKKITKSVPDARELMVIGGGHSTCFEQTDTVIMPALLDFYGIKK